MNIEDVIARHLPWIHGGANKMAFRGISADDLVSEASVAILEGLHKYDPTRGSLKNFVYSLALKHMCHYRRREHGFYRRWHSSQVESIQDQPQEGLGDFLGLIDSLPAKDSDLLHRYFGLGRDEESSKVIGESLGLSQSAVRMRVKSILDSLRKTA